MIFGWNPRFFTATPEGEFTYSGTHVATTSPSNSVVKNFLVESDFDMTVNFTEETGSIVKQC